MHRYDARPANAPLLLTALLLGASLFAAAPVAAGSPNFLWKPASESDGKLVVLFPSSLREKDVQGIEIRTADGRVDRPRSTSQTGANGDRIHARFSGSGASYGNDARVVMIMKDGGTRSWTIPRGAARLDRPDPGRAGAGDGASASLDDALAETGDGGEADGAGDEGRGRTRYTVKRDGTLRVSAYLHTWGPARLSVTLVDDAGRERTWLAWSRESDTDPSPLAVDGSPREDSMFEEKAGDFSPRATEVETTIRAGWTVETFLSGDFGPASPHLRVKSDPVDALAKD